MKKGDTRGEEGRKGNEAKRCNATRRDAAQRWTLLVPSPWRRAGFVREKIYSAGPGEPGISDDAKDATAS